MKDHGVLGVGSRADHIVRPSADWLEGPWRSVACPPTNPRQKTGSHPGRTWRSAPHAIDVCVQEAPRGVTCGTFGISIELMLKEFWDGIAPFLDSALVGRVCVDDGTPTDYVSVLIPGESAGSVSRKGRQPRGVPSVWAHRCPRLLGRNRGIGSDRRSRLDGRSGRPVPGSVACG
jgi:hypothetical protein